MMSEPTGDHRTFSGRRKVRLGDVTATGRLRLDALTRYTQDVSDDDTSSAGLDVEPGWVVRRTTVTQRQPAVLAETIDVTTYCSGLGRRWAERRLDIVGDHGARYEVTTLWICVDPATGRPVALSEQFLAIYGPSAGGRSVTARLVNPKLPAPDADSDADADSGAGADSGGKTGIRPDRWPWPLRVADFDTLGHVNNAAYWAVVEEALATRWTGVGPSFVATMEYSAGLVPTDRVTIASATIGGCPRGWWVVEDGTVAASVSIEATPP